MYSYILSSCIVGHVYRYCQNSNSWDQFINVSECSSVQLVELQHHAVELKNSFIFDEVSDILTYLAELNNVSEDTTTFVSTLQEQGPILPNDLNTTNNILDAIIWLVSYSNCLCV